MARVRGFDFPDQLFYLMEHDTWVRVDGDGLVTVGITALGCHISGDFIEFLPKPVGKEIERDRAFGMLEMSKTLRSARSPLNGTIAEINEDVRRTPTLTNQDPYGSGWLVRMKPANWNEEARWLVTGAAIPKAALDYMSLQLVHEFEQVLPPE